jgi:hypothetical protein
MRHGLLPESFEALLGLTIAPLTDLTSPISLK